MEMENDFFVFVCEFTFSVAQTDPHVGYCVDRDSRKE